MSSVSKEALQEFRNKLSAPFSAEDVEWRIQRQAGNQAVVLPYLQARAVMNRLDDVFGINNWRDEYDMLGQGVRARLWFRFSEDSEWLFHEDAADLTDVEPTKGAVSDSLKRAAVHLGIGRYMYDLSEEWVDLKTKKSPGDKYHKDKKTNTNYYWTPPTLPDWALPEDERGAPRPPSSQRPSAGPQGGSGQAQTASGPNTPPTTQTTPQKPSGDEGQSSQLPPNLRKAIESTIDIASKKGIVIDLNELIHEKFAKLDISEVTADEGKQLISAITQRIKDAN